MLNSNVPGRLALLACACSIAALSAGCSSLNDLVSNDKVDYRNGGSKTVNLEVPPDLSQLNGQGRYTLATAGTVSASNFNQQAQATAQTPSVAVKSLSGVTLERDGQVRWLSINQPPEQVWSQVREFWIENGFELPVDQAQNGLLETNWSENRAKLSQDGLRKLVGRLIDNLYDTGERDQFRTRVERTARGSEIYISHRGLTEIYTDGQKQQTTWKARPSDAGLEVEMLSRLMVKLGSTKEAAAQAAGVGSASSNTAAAPRARLLPDGLSVALGGDFDQAWRRVGLALDRGGFTIEDRDRSKGVYEVRLAATGAEGTKPGLLDKITGWFGSKSAADTISRYRLQLSTQGNNSTVIVQGTDGKPAESAGGRDVAKLLSANLE
jgi:outer membrane protein assembly factor BamC